MHLPPTAAVLRVNQLTTSPASSLWNVYRLTRGQLHRSAGDKASSGDQD